MPAPPGNRRCGSEIQRVLLEAFIVALAGLAIGLAANFFSPRGLSLTRNYFPSVRVPAPSASGDPGRQVVATAVPSASAGVAPNEPVAERLQAKGLQTVSDPDAEQLFLDPQREQELILFVDARDDHHFQEGHIPGAFQLDRYYPEKYLLGVLPACLRATKVVVYCTGGTCEDSEFAALALIEAGVARERVFVYPEGITRWAAQERPIEIGARNSGLLKGAKP